MSEQHIIANKAEQGMVAAPPATPPRRILSTRAPSMTSPAPAAYGLLTPPPSVFKDGRTNRSGATPPVASILIDFGDSVDTAAPAQPSIASPASATPVYSFATAISSAAIKSSVPRNPFEALALETIQHVASYIDSDQDLLHFIQSCKDVHVRIEDARNSFWRPRFLSKFERPRNANAKKWINNVEYKRTYQHRRASLKNGAMFKLGRTVPEKMCLQVLRDLINDSFSEQKVFKKKYSKLLYEDKNLAAVVKFCQNENILRSLLDPRNAPKRRAVGAQVTCEPLLQTIQALLTPLILCDLDAPMSDFPSSQISAYSSAYKQPIFMGSYGGTVNMGWVLNQTNFWKYHMTRETESTLFSDMDALEAAEYPKLWNTHLSQHEMPPLGKKWKGISAFLPPDEVSEIREDDPRDDIMDEFSGSNSGTAIQDLTLKLCAHDTTPAGSSRMFFEALNQHSPKKRTKTRSDQQDDAPCSDPRPFRMESKEGGYSAGQWAGDGWLSPLPSQNGIPGWQRVTMIKYWTDSDNNIDEFSLWAYEGVMLPGGRTVIGRWWSPDENATTNQQYSGPFILWNTED